MDREAATGGDEGANRALEQVDYERQHGGPGQEPATDPNAKVAWLESARADRADIAGALDRAASKAQEAAQIASGSKEIADKVRCVAEQGFESGRASQKLVEEEDKFAKVSRSEIGLDTVQAANDKALEEELKVPVLAVRDKLAQPDEKRRTRMGHEPRVMEDFGHFV